MVVGLRKMHHRRGRAAVCAPAARGRGRESGEGSIADGTALRYIVGEEVAATFGDTEDLFPEGSLFMSLRAIGYLLTHAECLLSVRQKKKILRSKDKDVRFTEIIVRGANRDKNSLLGKNKILYFVKEEERFLFYTNGIESHSNRIMRICIRFVLSI